MHITLEVLTNIIVTVAIIFLISSVAWIAAQVFWKNLKDGDDDG